MVRSVSPTERMPFFDDETVSLMTSSSSGEFSLEDDEKEDLRRRQTWNVRLVAWLRSRPRHLRRIFRRHAILSTIKYTVLLLIAILLATPIFAPSYLNLPVHYQELADRCAGPSPGSGCANPFKEKVFIAVSLYDPIGQHAAGPWGAALRDLIHLIGEDNVFLSIYENDSGPEGSHALEELEQTFRCRKQIVNDAHVPIDDFPSIMLPDGTQHVKRLAYLSEIRNRALRPLDMYDPAMGAYDKILFLNDVIFHPINAAQLLFSTNVGGDGKTQYLSACGLDFMNPFLFYDLYAQRDAEGFSNGLPIFPIFSNAGQGLSRAAMLAQKDAVPVSSCWGGIVAMQAQYVLNLNQSLPEPNFQANGNSVVHPEHPKNVTSPVRFRYEPEVFVDACECCLFLADVSQAARRAHANNLGTYVNPYVRVAYSKETLSWLPWVQRWERLFSIPQAIISPILGLPTSNPHRTVSEGEVFQEEIWVNDPGGGGHWEMVERKGRSGMFCDVREMQTILKGARTEDKNWQNHKMPAGQALDFPT